VKAGTLAALLLAALSLSACETTAEKSAELRRHAKHVSLEQNGLSIAHESRAVSVVGASVVRDSEGTAVAVTLRNHSARPLREVPVAITVKGADGRVLFRNDGAGLERALVAVPSIAARSTIVWVDDQVPLGGSPANVTARVGEAPSAPAPLPAMSIAHVHVSEDPANGLVATGTVSNRSKLAQKSLILFGNAARAGKIVAAGRQILPELAAGASIEFEVALLGDARGAKPLVAAPATSVH